MGHYEVTSVGGEQIQAFIPCPLPPEPPVALANARQHLLERATLALGRLDSITLLLPDPHIFLYAYVRREAVLSSQIEGTQSSLADLLLFELEEVEDTASNAVRTAQLLVALFKDDTARVQAVGRATSSALRVFNALCERPITTLNDLRQRTGLSFPTATKGIDRLMTLGIVKELTGGRRNRVFAYDRYLAILNEGTEPL
jgi:Fic family protein